MPHLLAGCGTAASLDLTNIKACSTDDNILSWHPLLIIEKDVNGN